MCSVNGPSWVLRYPICRARCFWLACVYSPTTERRCVLALFHLQQSGYWGQVPTGDPRVRLGKHSVDGRLSSRPRTGRGGGWALKWGAGLRGCNSLPLGPSRWCNSLLRGSLGDCNSLSRGWSSAGNSLAVRKSGGLQQSRCLALARARAIAPRSGGRPRAIVSRFESRVACNSLASRRSFGRVQQSRARAVVRVQQSRGTTVGPRATVSRLGYCNEGSRTGHPVCFRSVRIRRWPCFMFNNLPVLT